jgi:signal transduction histidine kinase
MAKILVIEDEKPVRMNLVAMLKAEGFQAIAAEDGQLGVQMAQADIPDLIICDITMPNLDGFRVLEVLQQSPTTQSIPFIFLSAKSERSDFRRGMGLGADDYLTKPFTRTELLEAVCTRLTKHAVVMKLKQRLEEIQQSNVLKDDFVNTIIHELRSPLATMKMSIELLQTTQNSQRHLFYLEALQAACNHEVELIDNLLNLQRLETQTFPIETETLHLQDWIPAIAEPFAIRAQQRQQILQVSVCAELPPVTLSRFSLERVVSELLNNACKYTPPHDKIILEVFQKQDKALRTNEASDDACIDQGASFWIAVRNEAEIPASFLPHLFDRFYRVPNGDRWQQGGTGLGLSLVKKFVEQMQGTIQVHSAEGWTSFVIQLPISLSLP